MIKTNTNQELLKKYSSLIERAAHLNDYLAGNWVRKQQKYYRDYLSSGSIAKEPLRMVPIYFSSPSYQSSTPDLVMVELGKQSLLLVTWVRGSGDFVDKVIGVSEGSVLTLMNTHAMSSDNEQKAFAEVFGGSFHTNSTKYPVAPLRYTIHDKEYGFSDGMQLSIGAEVTNTNVIKYSDDLKVRSNRKVTNKVNKIFKDYIHNARALEALIRIPRPVDANHGWDNLRRLKIAKEQLGLNNRLTYSGHYDNHGLCLNPQQYVTNRMFKTTIDEQTGVITPTANFDVVHKIIAAAKENNFTPMAYLLLDGGSSVEKRILNAIRITEGGFYIGE